MPEMWGENLQVRIRPLSPPTCACIKLRDEHFVFNLHQRFNHNFITNFFWRNSEERRVELESGQTLYTEKFSPQRESITVTESWGTRLCWVKGHHNKSFDFLCMLFNLSILLEWNDCRASLRKLKAEDDSENQSVRSSEGSSGICVKVSTCTLNNKINRV